MPPDPLALREVFHLAFLRALTRSMPLSTYVLKGGSNLRFFFGSPRYSEDMDLDAMNVAVHILRHKVMAILSAPALRDTLRTYGIDQIVPPNVASAKQTATVQRFKVHLGTTAGEDLSTKVEFSRRGFDTPVRSEPVSSSVLAAYRMPPLIVPHYPANPAALQKLRALASRRQPQARDIFDLYILSAHPDATSTTITEGLTRAQTEEARERIFSISYEQYRDTVVTFLGPEDATAHGSPEVWDEVRLRVASLLEGGKGT